MSDFTAKMHQIRFRLGLRPRPRWGSLQRSPRSPSLWGRGWLPLPKTPNLALQGTSGLEILRASKLGPSGLDTSSPGHDDFPRIWGGGGK